MVKTRLILNGYDLDVPDDVSLALTYWIADIAEPEKKQAHFSKSITLPATANNTSLFSNLQELSTSVNSSGTTNYSLGYDPNLKSSCQLIYDGQTMMTGYLQLVEIKKTDDYKNEFNVVIYSDVVNLFANIGDKYLSEVQLTEYNHPYTRDVQQASWNNYIWKSGGTQAFALGTGYVYPMLDYGINNDTDFKVSDFKTAIYVKTIVDKIINTAGYTYTSTFLNSTLFKSCIIPQTQSLQTLSAAQIQARTFRAANTSTEFCYTSGTVGINLSTYNSTILFQDETTTPNFDTGGVYNNSTGIFTASKAGTYKFTAHLKCSATFFPNTSPALIFGVGANSYPIGQIRILVTRASTGATQSISIGNIVLCNGTSSFNVNSLNINNGSTSLVYGVTSPSGEGDLIGQCYLDANDTVKVLFHSLPSNPTNLYGENVITYPNSYTRVNFEVGSYFKSEIADVSLMEGDTVDCSNILPKSIKQREFLSSIIKCFNLYIDSDKSTSNNLIIEPRDDFFSSSGTTRDWTNKLDLSKELSIIPMGYLDARTYQFKFKDDGDYYNKIYQDKWKQTYGEKRHTITNDFIKDVRTTEVIFSPSPLADRNSTDRILTRIWSVTPQTISQFTGNIRMLYYGGVKNTSFAWNYMASSGTNVMTTYPYAGHLDNPSFPNVDLNFDKPIEVFYTANSYTDGNLSNRYWRKFVTEITDKDSKLVRGYFYLTPSDIAMLDFRDRYYFERDFYRLNKISDYSPIELKSTLCEFIKVKESSTFTATSGTITGGNNVVLGVDTAPQYTQTQRAYNNQFGSGSYAVGQRNIVDPSARGCLISGSDNSVGANCENILISASSGCTVMPSTQNVQLIGCFGLTVDSRYNGLVVYDNLILGSKRILRKTSSYKGTNTDVGHFVLFNLSANGTYDLPESSLIYNGWSVEIKNGYTGSGYTVTANIVDSGVYFEDGVSTTSSILTTESFTFTYRNSVWYKS